MKFLTSIDLSQNEIQNAIMQPLAAPPANPKIGQIYFNSIDLTLYLWTGEKWIPVPTKTSQLENDSGFITSGDIPEGACVRIMTGAPVETVPFEEVDYWPELCEIMEWSKTHVFSTMHVCWGAQAALYYHFGIQKRLLPQKLSGIFEHRVVRPSNPLVRGFDDVFYAPHSRYTGIDKADVDECIDLRVLAESEEAGVYLLNTDSGRQIFVTGHPEYDKYTLDGEYRRDINKGLDIQPPKNYYPNDDPNREPIFRWRAHAHLLYHNWLNYYVYQNTPYDLKDLTGLE